MDTTPTAPIDDRPDRRAIGHAHTLAANAASAVSMPLGMWAGRGDWATYSDDFRTKAGARALTELDAAIAELQAVRARLAQAVGVEVVAAVTTPADQADQLVFTTEWTWRQNKFVGVDDATTDRAEAEGKARTCQAVNPNSDVGVMCRQVTAWVPAQPIGRSTEPEARLR